MGSLAGRAGQEGLLGGAPRGGSGEGGGNRQEGGREGEGARHEMAGGLAGDDHVQRAPVGQRPLLPPNQRYPPRTEPGRGEPGTGALPAGRLIRSEARRADRARH